MSRFNEWNILFKINFSDRRRGVGRVLWAEWLNGYHYLTALPHCHPPQETESALLWSDRSVFQSWLFWSSGKWIHALYFKQKEFNTGILTLWPLRWWKNTEAKQGESEVTQRWARAGNHFHSWSGAAAQKRLPGSVGGTAGSASVVCGWFWAKCNQDHASSEETYPLLNYLEFKSGAWLMVRWPPKITSLWLIYIEGKPLTAEFVLSLKLSSEVPRCLTSALVPNVMYSSFSLFLSQPLMHVGLWLAHVWGFPHVCH